MGVVVPPFWQIVAASWAWVGIPIVIAAGVGAVYRVAENLALLCYYLLGSFAIGTAACIWLLMTGSACSAVVAPEIQRMGATFVCSFTETFVLMWTLLIGLFHLYVTYVVWSAAQELAKLPSLRLIQYGAALANVQAPKEPSGLYALPAARAEPAPERGQPPPPGLPPTSGVVNRSQQLPAGGEPQSFIPSPPSGMDFAMSRAVY